MDACLIELAFDQGAVRVEGPPGTDLARLPHVLFDPRTSAYRAQGRHYRPLVEHLIRHKIPYRDDARGWENKFLTFPSPRLTP